MSVETHRHGGSDAAVAPYGSWPSPIDVELVAGSLVALDEPWLDGDDVYWTEGRATEGGRRSLRRRSPDGAVHELTPAPFYVGNGVHEYGGGSYAVSARRIVASSYADGRLWLIDPDGAGPTAALTPPGPWRFADLRFDPVRPVLYAVREAHDPDDDRPETVLNVLVALALDGSDGPGRVIAEGPDFVAAPRPSPDGRWLAWIEWDLPDMPWESTRLRVAALSDDGSPLAARTVAGGRDVSVVEPAWSADGTLHFVSDRTGWWNLYAFDGPGGLDGPAQGLAPMAAEIGGPAWNLGQSAYGFLPDGGILAVARSDGRDALIRIEADRTVVALETPFTELHGLRVGSGAAVAVAAGPHDGSVVALFDPRTGATSAILARALATPPDPAVLPHAEPITFPTGDGATARALFFPPTNGGWRGPARERPPLLVLAHGGPTSSARSALSLDRAFFTSRGIAVVDVDYRGSSGYGREYRDALRGAWGIADVEDCVSAARFLAERGDVDPERMAIRGGSAGGYTTLAALAFRPEVFAAGISRYGFADLELIHLDGHKFESRYDEGLLAPWPEGRQVFRDRSPIHFLDRIRAPMLILQGLDDRVVPPSQLDAMVAAFTARGIPHVAMAFEGEGHGFRRSETRRAVYRAELGFLARVFGFAPADGIEPLEIPGLGGA